MQANLNSNIDYFQYKKAISFYEKKIAKQKYSKQVYAKNIKKINEIVEKSLLNNIYDGSIEYFIFNQEKIFPYSPLKKIFKQSLLEEKKKAQIKLGGKCATRGNEIENILVNTLMKPCNELLVRKIFELDHNENFYFYKETNKKKKTDVYLVVENLNGKEKYRKGISVKSVQKSDENDNRTFLEKISSDHLDGSDKDNKNLFNYIQSLNKLSKEQLIDFEIFLKLLSNVQFFERKEYGSLFLSNKDEFDYWGNKTIFENMVKNHDGKMGMNGLMLKETFPLQYGKISTILDLISLDYANFLCAKGEQINYYCLANDFDGEFYFYHYEDIISGKINRKNIDKKQTGKKTKINDENKWSYDGGLLNLTNYITITAKGSGDKHLKQKENEDLDTFLARKREVKTRLQGRIKLKQIFQNVEKIASLKF